jgi:signal transduction histidine kinase
MPSRSPHCLTEIVYAALAHVEEAIDLTGIAIDVGGDHGAEALCDREAVEQVVVRLIGNAVAAAARQSFPRITIRTVAVFAPRDRGEDCVEFMIKHSGHSASARDGDRPRLAECRALIEAQGGRLWSEAEEWGRISFRFSLPLADR